MCSKCGGVGHIKRNCPFGTQKQSLLLAPQQHLQLSALQGQQRAPQVRGQRGQKKNQNHQQGGVINVIVVVHVVPSIRLVVLPTSIMTTPA